MYFHTKVHLLAFEFIMHNDKGNTMNKSEYDYDE